MFSGALSLSIEAPQRKAATTAASSLGSTSSSDVVDPENAANAAKNEAILGRMGDDLDSFHSRTLKDPAEEAADAAEDAAKDAQDAAEDAAKDAAKNAEDAAEEAADFWAGHRALYAHGGLMILGWGFLLPSGVILARLAKHRPGGLWFRLHRFLQISGITVAFVAWMIALNLFDEVEIPEESERYEDIHKTLGLIVMILGLFQPLNAVLRPHAPKDGEDKPPARFMWEVLHKGLGYTAVVLAAATISFGTTLLPTANNIKKKFQLTYACGAVGLLVVLAIVLLIDKFRYKEQPQNEPSDNEEKPQQQADEPARQPPETSPNATA